ncbi:MAG: hypothetical protein J7484_05895 [Microbacterium sp.]|nr:hypothetical protein [Microbacterium sp.]
MNATNRVANRIVLVLGAALLATAGVIAVVAGIGMPQLGRWLAAATRAAQDAVGSWSLAVAGGAELPGLVVVGAGIGILVVVLSVVFLATRGGGRTGEVWHGGGVRGETRVDRSVAEAMVAEAIATRPDVLSARLAAYRVKRTPTIAVTVTVRRGARLDEVLTAAAAAVGEWDALLGARTPVLVHLADGRWLDARRGRARVR